MLKHNLRYEWMQLTRDRWVIILLLVFAALCLFAAFNAKEKVAARQAETEKSINLMREGDEGHKAMIDSLDQGLKKDLPAWLNPKRLSFVGNRAPRVAAMTPAPLALISTGQSDLYTHSITIPLYGESYLLSFTELNNPVQLLFGSFDLSFVCLYLLPLLVLAFSYNLLSAEKEQGSLRLTMAQPVSLYRWLFGKMMVRFIIMTSVVWVSILLTLMLAQPALINQWDTVLKLLLMLTAYVFFWFLIALAVNAFGKSSGTNAVAMISVWVVLVLLLPAVIGQLANSIYPIPSRINMINEMRVAQAEAEKRADKILESYYRDHPELATPDTTVKNQYEFYLKYFASQDEVRNAIRPVLEQYQSKLNAQQGWIRSLRFLSPTLVVQNSMNDMAGTSTPHYNAYRSQVIMFAESWRNYFLPRMFRNEIMKKEDFASLPSFEYDYGNVDSPYFADLSSLLVFILALTAFSVWIYKRESMEQILA